MTDDALQKLAEKVFKQVFDMTIGDCEENADVIDAIAATLRESLAAGDGAVVVERETLRRWSDQVSGRRRLAMLHDELEALLQEAADGK
jgi:hypothetical protein